MGLGVSHKEFSNVVKAFVLSVIMKSLEDGVLKCGQNVRPNVNLRDSTLTKGAKWGWELFEIEDGYIALQNFRAR